MTDEIIRHKEWESVAERFTQMLNKQPSKKHIKSNNGLSYLPIGVIEKQLDEVYAGMWSTRNTRIEVMMNSIVCTLELVVYIGNREIVRTGVGAVPIEVQKGEREITPHTINRMAFQKNAPSAKSFALSNAAQSLGEVFGRNLNRQDQQDMDYAYLSEQVGQYEPLKDECIDLLKTAKVNAKDTIFRSIETASYEKLNDIKAYLTKNQ